MKRNSKCPLHLLSDMHTPFKNLIDYNFYCHEGKYKLKNVNLKRHYNQKEVIFNKLVAVSLRWAVGVWNSKHGPILQVIKDATDLLRTKKMIHAFSAE